MNVILCAGELRPGAVRRLAVRPRSPPSLRHPVLMLHPIHRSRPTHLSLAVALALGCGACQTGDVHHGQVPCASGAADQPAATGAVNKPPPKGARALTPAEAEAAAAELDVIAKGLDEFGSLSASAAVVLRRPREFFGFRLDLTPRDIFKMSGRIGAASTVGEFESLQVRMAVALKLLGAANAATDPVEAAKFQGQAEGMLASALVGDSEDGQGAGATGSNDADAKDTAPGLPNPTPATKPSPFSGADSLQDGALTPRAVDTLDIPLRQLIQQTFDDHTVLKLFEWFSAPDASTIGPNKEVFAAILNVSCRPGRRTYGGYVGEIAVQVGYARSEGEGAPTEQAGRHPLAFGVFPATDTQFIDERSSIRKQFALNLLFEAMVPNAGGSAGLDAVRRLNRDLATLSARNAVVGFNLGGSSFGWRFSPRLVAQTDPGAEETGSGSLLEPQTIPAVVLIVADREDIEGAKAFDHFVFHSAMRWSPAAAPSADESWVPFSREFHNHRHPRLRETDFVDWALRADRVEGLLAGQPPTDAQVASSGSVPTALSGQTVATLRKRLDLLRAAGLGADHYAAIPTERPAPTFNPPRTVDLWCDRQSDMLIEGERLEGAVTAASVAGRPARFEVLGERSLRIVVEPPNALPSSQVHPVHVSHMGGVSHVADVRFSLRGQPVEQARSATGRLEAAPFTLTGSPLEFLFASSQDVPAFSDKLTLALRQVDAPGGWRSVGSLAVARPAPDRLRIDLPSLNPALAAARYEIDLLAVAGDGLPARSILARPGIAVLANAAKDLEIAVLPTAVTFSKAGAAGSGLTVGTPALWALWASIDPSVAAIGTEGSGAALLLAGGGRNIALPLKRLPGGDVVVEPGDIDLGVVFAGLPPEAPASVTLTVQSLISSDAKPCGTPPVSGTVTFTRPVEKQP